MGTCQLRIATMIFVVDLIYWFWHFSNVSDTDKTVDQLKNIQRCTIYTYTIFIRLNDDAILTDENGNQILARGYPSK